MVEIVGSVAPEEVPEHKQRVFGRWSLLAERILADYEQRRVTVVKVKDDDELKALRNGLSHPLRRAGKRLRPVAIRQGDEIRVFCELVLRDVENGT